jgi:hypothetical protein
MIPQLWRVADTSVRVPRLAALEGDRLALRHAIVRSVLLVGIRRSSRCPGPTSWDGCCRTRFGHSSRRSRSCWVAFEMRRVLAAAAAESYRRART